MDYHEIESTYTISDDRVNAPSSTEIEERFFNRIIFSNITNNIYINRVYSNCK